MTADQGSKSEIPRWAFMERLTPAEFAIREAIIAVEKLPADVRLANAVALLQQAREKVADYIDEYRTAPRR